jgi:hypothetical protein
VGNRAAVKLLQRDTVDMEPIVITSTLGTVERTITGLDQLRGVGADPTQMSISRDAEQVRRNSPQADRRLPFTGTGGWDAQAVLTVLGQYDTNDQTDSDALRCVQAAREPRRPGAGGRHVVPRLDGA